VSYYILNPAGQPEGPYPAEWISSNASPSTLVSHQQRWVPYSQHPDFYQGSGAHAVPPIPVPVSAMPPVPAARLTPSPHWALLGLILPGVAHLVFGQVVKGLLYIGIYLATFPTLLGPVIMVCLAVIDAYKVGLKMRRVGSVGKWEFFPD
jgi:hypothetical protein